MKIETNIQRTDIIFGKVFLYRFASIFLPKTTIRVRGQMQAVITYYTVILK